MSETPLESFGETPSLSWLRLETADGLLVLPFRSEYFREIVMRRVLRLCRGKMRKQDRVETWHTVVHSEGGLVTFSRVGDAGLVGVSCADGQFGFVDAEALCGAVAYGRVDEIAKAPGVNG